MKFAKSRLALILAAKVLAFAGLARAAEPPAKTLLNVSAPRAERRFKPSYAAEKQVSVAASRDPAAPGLVVSIQPGDADYPGIDLKPEAGNAFDLSACVCGYLDTYGKWAQRYGYFEARVKLPHVPGLWPTFWMVPDRGPSAGPMWARESTGKGGMELDIMEHLTRWGPYRYNLACHWDGYDKDHQAIGSTFNYVQADTEGFITPGMLWTPGLLVYYCNGNELWRWEHPRVSNVPSHFIFEVITGGWDNNAVDDKQLPVDYAVDYVRVWQRKDLASSVDGYLSGAKAAKK
jgi:beta-glucanase (GH16 family)